jgi:NAD(P)H-dependent FMN reductase
VVGLISTSGGERAAANTTDAMVHIVHALRGVVAPSMVTIPGARRHSDGEGNITDESYGRRLDRLGRLVVEKARGLSAGERGAAAIGAAV